MDKQQIRLGFNRIKTIMNKYYSGLKSAMVASNSVLIFKDDNDDRNEIIVRFRDSNWHVTELSDKQWSIKTTATQPPHTGRFESYYFDMNAAISINTALEWLESRISLTHRITESIATAEKKGKKRLETLIFQVFGVHLEWKQPWGELIYPPDTGASPKDWITFAYVGDNEWRMMGSHNKHPNSDYNIVDLNNLNDLDLIVDTFSKIFPKLKSKLNEEITTSVQAADRLRSIIKQKFGVDLRQQIDVRNKWSIILDYPPDAGINTFIEFNAFAGSTCNMVSMSNTTRRADQEIDTNNIDDLNTVIERFATIFDMQDKLDEGVKTQSEGAKRIKDLIKRYLALI